MTPDIDTALARMRAWEFDENSVDARDLDTVLAYVKELRAANAQLTAERDEARRQRDECARQIANVRDRLDEFNDAARTPAECVAAMWRRLRDLAYPPAPATNDDARAILHAMASEVADSVVDAVSRAAKAAVEAPARPHVAVTVERPAGNGKASEMLIVRSECEAMCVTTDEAAALVTALLADGAVHERWLHGRGGR